MSNIDPHNLGEPVYKKNEVITRRDLIALITQHQIELKYTRWHKPWRKVLAVIRLKLLEDMYRWIVRGKPTQSVVLGVIKYE